MTELWKQLVGDLESKQPIVQVAMWTLGEYADLLKHNQSIEIDGEIYETINIKEDEVIDMCEKVLISIQMNLVTKEYTTGALIKLSVRFPEMAPRVKLMIDLYGCDHSVELQQRAVEFSALFSKYDHLRPSVLERMPPMTNRSEKRDGLPNGNTIQDEIVEMNQVNDKEPIKNEVNEKNNAPQSDALMDLLDLLS